MARQRTPTAANQPATPAHVIQRRSDWGKISADQNILYNCVVRVKYLTFLPILTKPGSIFRRNSSLNVWRWFHICCGGYVNFQGSHTQGKLGNKSCHGMSWAIGKQIENVLRKSWNVSTAYHESRTRSSDNSISIGLLRLPYFQFEKKFYFHSLKIVAGLSHDE